MNNSQSFPNIYIDGKPYNELIDLFNINISDDSEYYFIIAFNLLKYHQKKILSIFCDCNNKQKIGIINALSFIKINNFDTENFLLQLINDKDNEIVFHSILSLKYIDKNHSDKIEKFLSSNDKMLKNVAIQYLSSKNGLSFKNKLRDFLKDKNSFIREVALDELDDLDDEDLIDDAVFCLNDENEKVRSLAQYIINRLSQ